MSSVVKRKKKGTWTVHPISLNKRLCELYSFFWVPISTGRGWSRD